MTSISCFHIWYFNIPSSWSCIKVISPEAEMDCIRLFYHSLFLLVVDLPNGSDFPKLVGNTAIQYFFVDETFQNCSKLQFNSSMPNSGKISVETLSIISQGGCHAFFNTTPTSQNNQSENRFLSVFGVV